MQQAKKSRCGWVAVAWVVRVSWTGRQVWLGNAGRKKSEKVRSRNFYESQLAGSLLIANEVSIRGSRGQAVARRSDILCLLCTRSQFCDVQVHPTRVRFHPGPSASPPGSLC